MNLKSKIGQLIVGGYEGLTPPRELLQLVKNPGLGGVILFRNNLDDPYRIAKRNNEMQRLSTQVPLLIMVDQEGGRVSRLPPPFTQFPATALLGRCNSHQLCYQVGQATARELRAVGINMNLAPVLDIHTNPSNVVIGDRAFGSNPNLVSKLGLALMVGLQDNGVIACGKHFPGHGDTVEDSHHQLPTITHPLERLIAIELKPFQHAIENRLQAIMTAHVVYSALDPEVPATLSKTIITHLLRDAMRFRGLVLTDDLRMKAVTDHFKIADAAVRAINAGADLLLICHHPDLQAKTLEHICREVKQGAIPEKRIEQSLTRILSLKKHALIPHHPTSPKGIKAAVGHPDHKKIVAEIRNQSSTPHSSSPGAVRSAQKKD